MKKRMYLLAALGFAAAIVSCNKEPEVTGPVATEITSTLESSLKSAVWKNGDAVYVYSSDNKISKFQVGTTGEKTTVLKGSILPSKNYVAFYPGSAAPTWDGQKFSSKLPTMQTGIISGVSSNSNIAIGEGKDEIVLKSAVAYLSFSTEFGSHTISSVTLSANESLAGNAEFSLAGGTPEVKITSGSKTINLMGSSTIESGNTYYISVFPGKYTGVSITVNNKNGEKKIVQVGNVVAERNVAKSIATLNIPDSEWKNDPADDTQEETGPFSVAVGTISWADGKPAEGIVVSDGFNVTTTDADGKYNIKTSNDTRYIYFSYPANAKITVSNGCPEFFTKYDNMVKKYDFKLTAQAVENEFVLFAMADPQAHHTARSPQKVADTYRFKTETVPAVNKQIASQTLPCYGVTLGDIVYSENSRNSTAGMKDMRTNFGMINMPVFQTMGNHDYTYYYGESNPLKTDSRSSDNQLAVQRTFEDCFGPINYSFNRGNVHIICMKNIHYDSTTSAGSYHCAFTDAQWEWFKNDMSHVPADKSVILCVHIPLAGCSGASNTHVMDILNTMKTHPNSTVFSGHTHYYRGYPNVNGSGMYEHIHSAVCGQWWWSNIEGDGCPNGYTVYKINGTEIKDGFFAGVNDGMDGRDYQMRLYRGNITNGGQYAYFKWPYDAKTLFINLFNGDSRWKVEVYENDVYKGVASQMANNKKTYASVTAGETYTVDSASNQDWWAIGLNIGVIGRGRTSTSYYTNMFHMWKYTLSSADSKVKVVATDPYGNKYTCTDVVTQDCWYPDIFKAF